MSSNRENIINYELFYYFNKYIKFIYIKIIKIIYIYI